MKQAVRVTGIDPKRVSCYWPSGNFALHRGSLGLQAKGHENEIKQDSKDHTHSGLVPVAADLNSILRYAPGWAGYPGVRALGVDEGF